MRSALIFLSKHGPGVLAVGVLVGLVWPSLATLARPLMPATVFMFVLGPLLRVDAALVVATLRCLRISIVLPVFVMLLYPLLFDVVARVVGLNPDLRLALVLAVSAPPSSGTAAVARMLGLDAAVPIVVTLVSMVAAPMTIPFLADWVSTASNIEIVTIDPFDLASRLALLIGGAAIVAFVLRHWAPRQLVKYSLTLDALVVVALLIFALATMAGVRTIIESAPVHTIALVGIAYLCNISLQIIAVISFPGTAMTRITTGLTNGNRNVGLIWSVMGTAITPTMALYFAATQLPIYTMPWVIQNLIRRLPWVPSPKS